MNVDCVPVIEITRENLQRLWQSVKGAIKNASFIAIDCELSGLGDRRKLNFSEIDLRYHNTADIAREYAVISLGLSCFTLKSVSSLSVNDSNKGREVQSQDYFVQTFNILTLCDDSFMVEPNALKFLLSHSFDFNKLYAQGVLYQRGDDINKKKSTPCVRDIFAAILHHRKPIVLHNGFVDLAFMYQNFYLNLPKNIDMFASDLVDMFPAGIYDTKYIVEYFQKLPATYLEYIFKKMQLKNEALRKAGEWHVHLSFPPYPADVNGLNWYPYCQIHSNENQNDGLELCEAYKFHGNCSKGDTCTKSHDINRIVHELNPEPKKRRKNPGISDFSVAGIIDIKKQEQNGLRSPNSSKVRKRKRRSRGKTNSDNNQESEFDMQESEMHTDGDEEEMEDVPMGKKEESDITDHQESSTEPLENDDSPQTLFDSHKIKKSNSSGHRAGFDAFMTGYIFASQISLLGELRTSDHNFTYEDIKMSNMVNRVYLIGKGFPFLVKHARYSKSSQNHLKKIGIIRDSS